jgi:hypothetical protein
MRFDQETLQQSIPYYLTEKDKSALIKALNDFPNVDYYSNLYPNDILQGDGWTSLDVVNIKTLSKKSVQGIILSNSCDIDDANIRPLPAFINFCPIIRLSDYISKLEQAGMSQDKISSKIETIKKQLVTNIFYMPKNHIINNEYIALLDDIHTIKLSDFKGTEGRKKIFTLSQVGFYIFLFKISVHFCRFQEALKRNI